MHIIQRGNNRSACFFADTDYRVCLDWLREYSAQTHCSVHACVLMTNHVHLLLSAEDAQGAGAPMKALGQRYVQYINRTNKRGGTLWEGRYRSCLTQAETYLLDCMRYIELNPVRAGMVTHPGEYRWSSYHANAQGAADGLLTPHALCFGLGSSAEQRQAQYRQLFGYQLDPGVVDGIRQATNGNYALGETRFAAEIGKMLGRRVMPGASGRPRKMPEPETGELL